MIYFLDTNAVSDWLAPIPNKVEVNILNALRQANRIILCQPVYYELHRGLIAKNQVRKLKFLQSHIMPLLEYIELSDTDWMQAAQFWADANQAGKRLADIDLLLAALAYRLDAVIVTADDDFDALPVKRENWRNL